MRTLYLLRHAKSAWDNPTLDDYDRPLDPRGERAALLMGEFLRQRDVRPSRVLCSSANRARQTWRIVASRLAAKPAVETLESLYLCGADGVLREIRGHGKDAEKLLVIGHNPDLHDLAKQLAGADRSTESRALAAKFPTAAIAAFACDIDTWTNFSPAFAVLSEFVRPKHLV